MTNIIEQRKMPLVPLRGVTVFPNMIMHLDIGRSASINAIEAAMVADRKIFLVTQKSIDDNSPEREDLYEVGTIAAMSEF